jgi:hypothetical protein
MASGQMASKDAFDDQRRWPGAHLVGADRSIQAVDRRDRLILELSDYFKREPMANGCRISTHFRESLP